jgi:hypothetical protein
MKLQHFAVFAFMSLALIAKGYADDIPAWTKLITDTAVVSTGLAALCMRPPWEVEPKSPSV